MDFEKHGGDRAILGAGLELPSAAIRTRCIKVNVVRNGTVLLAFPSIELSALVGPPHRHESSQNPNSVLG